METYTSNFFTRHKMKMIGFNFDGDCPLYHHEGETIDHLFKNCNMAKSIWLNTDVNCLILLILFCLSLIG